MGVLNRFKADQGGTTAVLFGLAALPLVGMVGATVDYTRAATEQSRLQRATDATVLALVRESRTATKSQLEQRAAVLYRAHYSSRNPVLFEDPTVERSGDTITLSRKGRVTNAFMQVLGIPETGLGARASVDASSERIELALVLDNTGSMRETIDGTRKIDALKDAAIDLLAKLRDAAIDRDAVRVSIVPFDTEVRVPAATYRYQDWIRWKDRASNAERNAWTGYLVDRYQPNDVSDAAPSPSNIPTLYPKVATSQWASYGDLAYVQPLTSLYGYNDYAAVQSAINAMQPRGNTNVGLGVAWGTATLTGSVPLATAAVSDARKVKRFMVVLTDGANTQKWVNGEACTPTGSGCRISVATMDERTARACDTAKDPKGAGIEVFTIRLLDGGEALLQSCASPPNAKTSQHYFNVKSKPDLSAAFRSIVDTITQTRVTS